MPELIFTHSSNGSLVIDTGMNEIEWGYILNTQSFPTYGGEVVQILSCFIEDLTVIGDVADYTQLEQIYNYFVTELRTGTQPGQFDPEPIVLHYAERGWQIPIRPKQAPSFRYGRDVVVPQWKLVAAVVEQNMEVAEDVFTHAMIQAAKGKGGIDLDKFNKLDSRLGYVAENPFSNPFPNSKSFDDQATKTALGELADYFHSLIPAYSSGDFPDLINDGSAPLFLHGGNGDKAGSNPNATATKTKTAPKKK